MSATKGPPTPVPPRPRRSSLPGVMALLVVGAGGVWLAVSPAARAATATALTLLWHLDVTGLRDFLAGYADRAWIVTSLLMILQSLAAPIPAVPITLANALLYGPWLGALISWSSAEVAAALCFLLARFLGRGFVERLFPAAALARIDGFFTRHGLGAVLVLRLIPYVSFDIVSYAAGLTGMTLLPFLLATGLGQLPATLVYSFAGARLATDVSRAAQIALAFLGVTALAIALVTWRRRARRGTGAPPPP